MSGIGETNGKPALCPLCGNPTGRPAVRIRESINAAAVGLRGYWRSDPNAALMSYSQLDDFARSHGLQVVMRFNPAAPYNEPTVTVEPVAAEEPA